MGMQAFMMGFGGTGAHILTHIKENLYIKYGNVPEYFKFLYMDTLADWKPGSEISVQQGKIKEQTAVASIEEKGNLDPQTEYYQLLDRTPSLSDFVYDLLPGYGNEDRVSHLKNWLHASWLGDSGNIKKASLAIAEGAAQQRQIGRFAMFQNVQQIVNHTSSSLQQLNTFAAGQPVNIWIIGSSAGGTGAGCIIDAAYMARLAAERAGISRIQVYGVIVFPNVYSGMAGIIEARAYSLFREMERVQGVLGVGGNISPSDKYRMDVGDRDIFSHVVYDPNRSYCSNVESALFDRLFYVGNECNNEPARKKFFSSVANGIDPYLDDRSGPPLLEGAVNLSGAASAFGASKFYIPKETLIELFAWQEVENYLTSLTAPKDAGNIYYGASNDRQEKAEEKIKHLLYLFDRLFELTGLTEDQQRQFGERTLTPETIVKEYYQLFQLDISEDEKRKAAWTYINPYISFKDKYVNEILPDELKTKSYAENRKLPKKDRLKENELESRDRFHKELNAITKKYTDKEGGNETFEEGRKILFNCISDHLCKQIDSIITDSFQESGFTFCTLNEDGTASREGTGLTKLYKELQHIVAEGEKGILYSITQLVEKFVKTYEAQKTEFEQNKVNTLEDIKDFKQKSGLSKLFSGGPSIDQVQTQARSEMSEYIEWYQKNELLKDMKNLVYEVKKRFEDWNGVLKSIIDSLTLSTDSCLKDCVEAIGRLEKRLQDMAQNENAIISLGGTPERPDTNMQGFKETMKKMALFSEDTRLVERIKNVSKWESIPAHDKNQDKKDKKTVGFSFTINFEQLKPELPSKTYTNTEIKQIAKDLHKEFHSIIKDRLTMLDIYDYMIFLQGKDPNVPANLATRLFNEAAPLIEAANPDDFWLVYQMPPSSEKDNFMQALQTEIKKTSLGSQEKPPITEYMDNNSISLVRVRKPSLSEINDLNKCRNDYLTLLRAERKKVKARPEEDEKLRRSQVFHPFRQELEAWYIERQYCKAGEAELYESDLIPPRIVRLLEHPDMMQAFVDCIATGAIEKKENDDGKSEWVWHNTRVKKDYILTDRNVEPDPTLVMAAVVFVLQRREAGTSLKEITLKDAQESAVTCAQNKDDTKNNAVQDFIANQLNDYLNKYFPYVEGRDEQLHEREKKSLKLIFEFYGNPKVGTDLRNRSEL
jgi:hypothetical protein